MIKRLVILLCAISVSAYASQHCDLEYWQRFTVNQWERGPYRVYAYGEARVNEDISHFYYYQLTENLAYQICPNWTLEAHYTFIYDKPITASHFRTVNRLELEANPQHVFANGVTLRWRNRFQIVKIQNVSSFRFVLRHRAAVEVPLEGWGRLRSYGASDEVFYHINEGRLTQNRLIPLELSFQLTSNATINTFLMVRQFLSANHWYHSVVLGSLIAF